MAADEVLLGLIIGVLGTDVLDRDAITDAISERSAVPGPKTSLRDRIDRLLQFDTRFSDVADGTMFVPAVLEGTTWTVRVDPADAADGFVRMHPHLDPLGWWLVGADVNLVDSSGAALGALETDGIWLDDRDTDVVFGPDGWLEGLAGGWASVAVARGGLCWSPCPVPPTPSDRQAAALRAGFARAAEVERVSSVDVEPTTLRFTSGDGPMLEALIEDRDAFVGTPVAPLPDLYRSAGLVERSGIVAEDGFDWDALRSWQHRNGLRAIYGLSPDQADRLMLTVGALQAYSDEGPAGLGANDRELDGAATLFTAVLGDGEVASALWRELVGRDIPLEVVVRFADELAARAEGTTPVGLGWLRARCLDWSGDASAAAELLAQVVTGSCTHVPAWVDAAGFASDRGDAPTAYRLLREAGVVDDPTDEADEETSPDDATPLVLEVAGFALHRPRPSAGRNDACPCGSGRKYKACHLGREQHTLADRSAWLYDKAKRFLQTRHPDSVAWLAEALSEPSESIRVYEELIEAPFVVDVALHEEGVFAEFLAARSSLLPDDEALLAAQWELVDRGVFEIQRIDDDRIDVYDIGRDEQITVVNAHPSSRTRVGTVMLGRPLPVGDTYRAFSGFIEVPRAVVADALEVIDGRDPEDLVVFLGDLFRPPRLQNTDGHDLELHTIRWRIPESRDVEGALRAAGLQRDDDEPVWRMMRASPGAPDTVIATVEHSGEGLVAEVNSRQRAEALLATIAAAIPDAELIDDTATSIDDAIANHEPGDLPAQVPPIDPAVRQALATFVADQERRWIDESIPALGGRTPRDAATDPIGREQLTQLLDSFPVPDDSDVGAMNPQRLRSALGL